MGLRDLFSKLTGGELNLSELTGGLTGNLTETFSTAANDLVGNFGGTATSVLEQATGDFTGLAETASTSLTDLSATATDLNLQAADAIGTFTDPATAVDAVLGGGGQGLLDPASLIKP